MSIRSLLSVAAVAALCFGAVAADNSSSKMQSTAKFKFKATKEADLEYLLYLPESAKAGEKTPLMLFLHGAGERGNDVWLVAKHGPPKIVNALSAENKTEKFPFILVSPQCKNGQVWSTEVLLGLLDEIEAKYPVDKSRVYLTGLSMGGYGTWALGLSHPDRFAAIAPICGGGEIIGVLLASQKNAAAMKSLGVWAFHGAKDNVVPLSESQRMVDVLKRVGVPDVKLTVYPEATHDSWTETYNNPELYKWFLQHKR